MRIISGQFKGRRIKPPANLPVRPTTDKAKEALFNILMTFDYEESRILDLFAGTGNISYEFISRGCSEVIAVEQNGDCVRFMESVAEHLDIGNLRIQQTNVFKYLTREHGKFDVIFADPPYDLDELPRLPDLIFENNLLNAGGIFILEHDDHHNFSNHFGISDYRKYGKVRFSIFTNNV